MTIEVLRWVYEGADVGNDMGQCEVCGGGGAGRSKVGRGRKKRQECDGYGWMDGCGGEKRRQCIGCRCGCGWRGDVLEASRGCSQRGGRGGGVTH